MEDFRDKLRRQIDLEDEGRCLGQSRYHNRTLPWRTEVGSLEEEANMPPGKFLLKACVDPMAEAITTFLKEAFNGKAGRRNSAADFLLLTDPIEVAYLTTRVVVNMSTTAGWMQVTALKVANALIDNLEFKGFREVNRVGYKGYMKQQAARGYSRQRRAAVRKLFEEEGVLISVSPSERVNIGLKCIELLIESTGLFIRDTKPKRKGMAYYVRPSEALQDWLDKQHARCSLLEPVNMPMIVRPRRWRTPTHGGYITHRPGNLLVKQRNKAYHEELRSVEMDGVYASVNHIQDTAWSINQRVLDVMEAVWDGGAALGGLPQRNDDELPTRPEDIDHNEEARLAWKREAAQVYESNAQMLSGRLAMQQGLWMARRFQDEKEIFFPHSLDFRGRIYPIPSAGPSPQGCDWQKALLQFADGKPLGEDGRNWLMIHIANLFGVDKVSFDDRIDWVLAHYKQLLDSADQPLDGERFWTTADDPYSALAACFEFAGMLEHGVDFVSRLPIALDGSCSGLQHFSAMLRDEKGGAAVNLLPAEKPQDVYTSVSDMAQAVADATPFIQYQTKDGAGELVDMTIANPWREGKISRKLTKRPTMTFCYSATRFGMQGMILSTLREIDRELEKEGEQPYLNGADNYHSAMWLSHVLFSSISQTVEAAAVAMDWLRSAATIAAKAEVPLWWTTPMGLPILQEYKKQKGKRVRCHWAGQSIHLILRVDEEGIDTRSQTNGVAPNYVHSLDAAHLQSVALESKHSGIQHIAVIHDSFGTHACDTGRLSEILRETFVTQYSSDVLQNFYEELKEQLGEELGASLPTPPAHGTLDLSRVLEAEYTFA